MQGCIAKNRSFGVTLINLMITVSILSLISLVALPVFKTDEKYLLERVAAEIAFAVRFARSESQRTGAVYGVDIDRVNGRVSVYKADLTANPVGQEFVAFHPLNKDLYDYSLVPNSSPSTVKITNSEDPFLFTDTVRRKSLLFDANGIPIWIDSSTGNSVQLSNADIQISNGQDNQSIQVQPFTGRVTAQ